MNMPSAIKNDPVSNLNPTATTAKATHCQGLIL